MEKWIVFAEMLGMLIAVIGCGYAMLKDLRRPLNEQEVARLQLLGNRHPEVARLIIEWGSERDVFVVVDLDVAEREAARADARNAQLRARRAMNALASSVVVANQTTGQTGAARRVGFSAGLWWLRRWHRFGTPAASRALTCPFLGCASQESRRRPWLEMSNVYIATCVSTDASCIAISKFKAMGGGASSLEMQLSCLAPRAQGSRGARECCF